LAADRPKEGSLVIYNANTGELLGDRVALAATLVARVRGLIGRRRLETGEGLWLVPCSAIHMVGVRFPIDVLFLDRELRVLKVVHELPPNRLAGQKGACTALELPAGTLARTGTRSGHVLRIEGPSAGR